MQSESASGANTVEAHYNRNILNPPPTILRILIKFTNIFTKEIINSTYISGNFNFKTQINDLIIFEVEVLSRIKSFVTPLV